MTEQRIQVGEITLNVVDVGEGPAVLLLHGFPDRAAMWQHQIEALRAAGHRVIAPDLRGFGDSDRPADPAAYGIQTVLGDIIGLLDHLGVERVSVAAHDWGAAVAWAFATFFPARVERLAAISVGHPRAFIGAGFEQKQLSWYMLWFQFPAAEAAMAADDWAWFRKWAFAGAERAEDVHLDRQLTDLSRPGALVAGLNWYRANVSPATFAALEGPQLPPVGCPVLGIWSEYDMALSEQQMTGSAAYVAGPWRYERIEGVGHWIPCHAPERTSELLVEFFS